MRCKSCNKEIIWVTMESGKKIPVDKYSISKKLVISGDEKQGAIRKTGIPHFKTCPHAENHRRKK